eukprot:m.81386 g.81386  ORF g.81386 m.81386 type:complete len:2012 (-) comp14571_c0_seq2:2031-8066(-)
MRSWLIPPLMLALLVLSSRYTAAETCKPETVASTQCRNACLSSKSACETDSGCATQLAANPKTPTASSRHLYVQYAASCCQDCRSRDARIKYDALRYYGSKCTAACKQEIYDCFDNDECYVSMTKLYERPTELEELKSTTDSTASKLVAGLSTCLDTCNLMCMETCVAKDDSCFVHDKPEACLKASYNDTRRGTVYQCSWAYATGTCLAMAHPCEINTLEDCEMDSLYSCQRYTTGCDPPPRTCCSTPLTLGNSLAMVNCSTASHAVGGCSSAPVHRVTLTLKSEGLELEGEGLDGNTLYDVVYVEDGKGFDSRIFVGRFGSGTQGQYDGLLSRGNTPLSLRDTETGFVKALAPDVTGYFMLYNRGVYRKQDFVNGGFCYNTDTVKNWHTTDCTGGEDGSFTNAAVQLTRIQIQAVSCADCSQTTTSLPTPLGSTSNPCAGLDAEACDTHSQCKVGHCEPTNDGCRNQTSSSICNTHVYTDPASNTQVTCRWNEDTTSGSCSPQSHPCWTATDSSSCSSSSCNWELDCVHQPTLLGEECPNLPQANCTETDSCRYGHCQVLSDPCAMTTSASTCNGQTWTEDSTVHHCVWLAAVARCHTGNHSCYSVEESACGADIGCAYVEECTLSEIAQCPGLSPSACGHQDGCVYGFCRVDEVRCPTFLTETTCKSWQDSDGNTRSCTWDADDEQCLEASNSCSEQTGAQQCIDQLYCVWESGCGAIHDETSKDPCDTAETECNGDAGCLSALTCVDSALESSCPTSPSWSCVEDCTTSVRNPSWTLLQPVLHCRLQEEGVTVFSQPCDAYPTDCTVFADRPCALSKAGPLYTRLPSIFGAVTLATAFGDDPLCPVGTVGGFLQSSLIFDSAHFEMELHFTMTSAATSLAVVISDDETIGIELGLSWDGAAGKLYVQDLLTSSNNAFNATKALPSDRLLVLRTRVAFNYLAITLEQLRTDKGATQEIAWLYHELPLSRATWTNVGWIANSKQSGRTMCMNNVSLRNSSTACNMCHRLSSAECAASECAVEGDACVADSSCPFDDVAGSPCHTATCDGSSEDTVSSTCCNSIKTYCAQNSDDPGCACGGLVSEVCPFSTLNCVECRADTAPQVLEATEDCLGNTSVTVLLNNSVPFPLADTIVQCLFWREPAGGGSYACKPGDCNAVATLVDAKTVQCAVPSLEYSQEVETRIAVKVVHKDTAVPNRNTCSSTLGTTPRLAYHYAGILACGPLSAPAQEQCPFTDYTSDLSPCTQAICRNTSNVFSGSSLCCEAARTFCDTAGNLNDRGCDCAEFASSQCSNLPDICSPQEAQSQCSVSANSDNTLRLEFAQSYAQYIGEDSSTSADLFRAVVTASLIQRGVATAEDFSCINLRAAKDGHIESQVVFTTPEVAQKARESVDEKELEFVFDGASFAGSAKDAPPTAKKSRGLEAIVAGAAVAFILVVLLVLMLKRKRTKRADHADDGFQADSFELDGVGTLQLSYSLNSMDGLPAAAIPEVPTMAVSDSHASPLRAMTMVTNDDAERLLHALAVQPIHLACLRNDATQLEATLRQESPRVSRQHLTVPATPSSGGYSPVPDIDGTGSGHTTISSSQGMRMADGLGSGYSTLAPGIGMLPLDGVGGCTGDEPPSTLLRDAQGRRAVHYAVFGNATECLASLLRYGTDVDATDQAGRSPLHYAASTGAYGSVVGLLLKGGAKTERVDKEGNTPLSTAVTYNHADMLDACLLAGGDLSSLNERGETLLMQAIQHGGHEVLQVLLLTIAKHSERDMLLNAQDRSGRTALHWACKVNDTVTVLQLAEMQATLGLADHHNNTAFHAAAHEGNPESIVALAKLYPDDAVRAALLTVNSRRETAMDAATRADNHEAMLALMQIGERIAFDWTVSPSATMTPTSSRSPSILGTEHIVDELLAEIRSNSPNLSPAMSVQSGGVRSPPQAGPAGAKRKAKRRSSETDEAARLARKREENRRDCKLRREKRKQEQKMMESKVAGMEMQEAVLSDGINQLMREKELLLRLLQQ